MSKIMYFRGERVDSDMPKEKLLEVIVYLVAEMNDYKSENSKYSDVINYAKLKELKIPPITKE